jgi:uncharacterized membrane protein
MIEIIPNWHPVFVHFTVALLIIAAAIHLLSHFLPKGELANQLTIVARWNLWFGVGFTLLTIAAGWYAFNTVAHDAPSHIRAVTWYRRLGVLLVAAWQKQGLAVHRIAGHRGGLVAVHRMAWQRTGLPLWSGRDVHAQT